MYLVTSISILAVFLTYLSKYPKYKSFFKIAFILISLVGCLHYNFGTDYDSYYRIFRDFTSCSFNDIIADDFYNEQGWSLLNIIFLSFGDPLGFFILVAFINIVQNVIFYKFINRYVYSHIRWLAMLIYLFTESFYPLNFSMMTQGFAISLIVYSVMKFLDKKYFYSFLFVFFAFTIHKSAIIFLPFLFLGFIKFKDNNKRLAVVMWASVAIVFLISSFTSSLFTTLIALEAFESYQTYEEMGTATLGLGFILMSMPYFVITYFVAFNSDRIPHSILIMSLLLFVTLVLTPFTMQLTLVGRLSYYFSIFSIVVVPNLYYMIKTKFIRYSLLAIYLFVVLYGYSAYFNPNGWQFDGFNTYRTIFEAI